MIAREAEEVFFGKRLFVRFSPQFYFDGNQFSQQIRTQIGKAIEIIFDLRMMLIADSKLKLVRDTIDLIFWMRIIWRFQIRSFRKKRGTNIFFAIDFIAQTE